MKTVLELLTEQFEAAFEQCGYDKKYAKVTLSNRPDLCEYQCNGAMAAVKEYKKAPIMIATDVVEKLKDNDVFEEITAVNPGFINMKVSGKFISDFVNAMSLDENLGVEKNNPAKTIIIDYGGANVAKPLHVGHLRPAVIGESIKRLCRFAGDKVIGDVHLGDWGMPIGLIIEQLRDEQPELVYFDESYTGEYPAEPPFDITELERIYPFASKRSKEDAEFKERAHQATLKLQEGLPAFRAIWEHIMKVSVTDLKKNYGNLNVDFDLWYGESTADPLIKPMVDDMIEKGFAYESQGAMVVDVKEETDTKEYPPCIVRKSDGAALYATSDLATIIQRVRDYDPDLMVYITDKRQEMHFDQVFRVARKVGLVSEKNKLTFHGNGTMNGKDGKPFKTRDGGVMRLEMLLKDISDAVYEKIMENRSVEEEEARKTAKIVGLAALKYGDLSNQIGKDYIFDIERFISFEGNTGPYILYTIVRIKSILAKYAELGKDAKAINPQVNSIQTASEKALMIELSKFNEMIKNAYEELAPHKVCSYIFNLSDAFNTFYHDNRIMAEEDEKKQAGYINLLETTKKTLEKSIDILGFEAPERM
ncbi:MAG: arginine--tRNA ligase [Lachnospiraceae bacterium]|nr:arginine--tRNA ligase [Lachnospiraceae bacterium]